MEHANRKSIRDAMPTDAETEAPTSPTTYLELDVEAANGRRRYQGRFKFKVPTMGDRVDIAALKARYCQELKIDRGIDNVAEAIAYLAVTLDSDPKNLPGWWVQSKGGIDLYDFAPLLALYAKARAYEATFLGGDPNAGDDAGEGADEPDDDADGDVGGAVPDTADGPEVLAEFGKRTS